MAKKGRKYYAKLKPKLALNVSFADAIRVCLKVKPVTGDMIIKPDKK